MRCLSIARSLGWTVLWSCLFWAGATTGRAQFFVASDGDDAAVGTAGDPWRTLQHAADQVGPGNRVTVRSGTYTNFRLLTSGTASNPIEFIAEPGVLINTMQPGRPDGINLELASHVVIDGFNITGMDRAGVRSVGLDSAFAENVTIRNISAFDNGVWGIFTGFVNDLLIEDNSTSGSIDEHGIYVSNSGDRPVIQRNATFGNNGNGIHMNGDMNTGEGIDGVISDALVSGNTIFDNGLGGGSGINMDGVINSRIENNLLFDNHASGISLFQIDGGAPSTGNVIVNNTIHQAEDGRWALNIQNGSVNNTAYNNILISEHPFRGAIDISPNSLSGFDSDYNVVIDRFTTDDLATTLTLAAWQAQTGNDMHSLVGNANELFVDWPTSDYQLLANAVARDAGTAMSAPSLDLDGAPRPIGASHDIGAFEYRIIAEDLNTDGFVDGLDLGILLANWNRTVAPFRGELNGAPPVDGLDLGILLGAWNPPTLRATSSPTAVPEPTTGLSGIALLLIVAGRQSNRSLAHQ